MYLVDFVKVILVFVSLLPPLKVLDVIIYHITQSSYPIFFWLLCSEPDDMKNVLDSHIGLLSQKMS